VVQALPREPIVLVPLVRPATRRKGGDGRQKIGVNSSSADLSSYMDFTVHCSFLCSSDQPQMQTGN